MTKTIGFAVLALALALGGCKKKDEKKADQGGKPTEAGKGGDKGGETPAAGPLMMTAADLWKDYTSRQGADLMDHYKNGVTVSGTIKQVMDATEMGGTFDVWLDVDGTNWISLGFKDQGAAAKAKAPKQGDSLTAMCNIGGMSDKYIMAIDCDLK
jgi:putative nucleic acid binding protein